MLSPTSATGKLQVVETARLNSSDSREKKNSSAADYTIQFKARVVQYFRSTQSIRQTAEKYGISARTVNEILHVYQLHILELHGLRIVPSRPVPAPLVMRAGVAA